LAWDDPDYDFDSGKFWLFKVLKQAKLEHGKCVFSWSIATLCIKLLHTSLFRMTSAGCLKTVTG